MRTTQVQTIVPVARLGGERPSTSLFQYADPITTPASARAPGHRPTLMSAPHQCRLILAEGDVMFRTGLRTLLHDRPGVEVVAETARSGDVPRLIKQHEPDLVVIGTGLGGGTSLDLAKQIRTLGLSVAVLALSDADGEPEAEQFSSAGATGYVTRNGRVGVWRTGRFEGHAAAASAR